MDCNNRYSDRLANLERDLQQAQQYVKDHHLTRTPAASNLRIAATYLKDANAQSQARR